MSNDKLTIYQPQDGIGNFIKSGFLGIFEIG